MTNDTDRIRSRIEAWYQAGLAEVDPAACVARAVEWTGDALKVEGATVPVEPDSRLIVVAIGKAATEMARGLASRLGDRPNTRIILTRDDHAASPPDGWEVFEARHPVPDQRGMDATRRILDAVSGLSASDVVIFLVSGGGSALFESPRAPLGLDDIQEVTSLLLRAGAPIQDLNAVRSELSDVKGGGFRLAIGVAPCVSLILSDVLGNDPSVIASGPTIVREARPDLARETLERYGLTGAVPQAVRDVLGDDGGKRQVADLGERDVFTVVGDNESFLSRIRSAAENDGFRAEVVLPDAEGEARDLANHFLDLATHVNDAIDVIIGGGEATVTVRGDGEGGRNTEFALAAAQRLETMAAPWVVASLASDGQDGTLNAAGAIVDGSTISRGARVGLDATRAMAANDSGTYLERTGDLVKPGPTGTNVNDVYIAVRVRQEPS